MFVNLFAALSLLKCTTVHFFDCKGIKVWNTTMFIANTVQPFVIRIEERIEKTTGLTFTETWRMAAVWAKEESIQYWMRSESRG